MKSDTFPVYLSPVDEQRFNIRVAKAPDITLENLQVILEFCRKKHVILLIGRCLTSRIREAQEMERHGFKLMDTLAYYVCDLTRCRIETEASTVRVRSLLQNEEKTVHQLAAKAFRSYFGHYHADDRLDHIKCDEVYADWALQTCVSSQDEHKVFVASRNSRLDGFIALRMNSPEESEVRLLGVDPQVHAQGIARLLMIQAMQWCQTKRIASMMASTQIDNIPSQKVWTRLGFEISHSCYTFHKWFDKGKDE